MHLCPTILRNRAALLLSQYAIVNLHYFVSLAAFHSGRSVAEEQWFWKVWLGRKDCSGGKDYVLCDQSLQFDSLLFHKTVNFRQVSYSYLVQWLWFGKQILHVKKSCCKKILEISNFSYARFCCQLKGFILNIDVNFLYIETSSISQTELKTWDVFFTIKKALHDA